MIRYLNDGRGAREPADDPFELVPASAKAIAGGSHWTLQRCISAGVSKTFASHGAWWDPGAPVVAALGGISAGTRRGGAARARLVERNRRSRQGTRHRSLSGAWHRFSRWQRREHRPARGSDAIFPRSARTTRQRCCVISSCISTRTGAGDHRASYGGMVALAFAERWPSWSPHPCDQRSRSITSDGDGMAQRAARDRALCPEKGDGPEGFGSREPWRWRLIAVPQEFAARFDGRADRVEDGFQFPVESYLLARGDAYAATYIPEAFVCLSESIDLHRVDAPNIRVPTTLVAVREDQLVPLRTCARYGTTAGPAELVEFHHSMVTMPS